MRRRDFPLPPAYPYAWPVPPKGKVSAAKKLKILPEVGAALLVWAQGGGDIPYDAGTGSDTLDALLRKTDSNRQLLGAVDGRLWVVDGFVGLRVEQLAPLNSPMTQRTLRFGSSLVERYLRPLSQAVPFEVPHAPLWYDCTCVRAYIGPGAKPGEFAWAEATALAVLAAMGTIHRHEDMLCAKDAAGEIVAFCNIVPRSVGKADKDAAGAPWALDGVDTRDVAAPEAPTAAAPTHAARPTHVASLAGARKAVSWHRTVTAYCMLVQHLARNGGATTGPVPSGSVFIHTANVMRCPRGIGTRQIFMVGGLLSYVQGTADAAQMLKDGLAQYANMKLVARFLMPADPEMDRASDGTPRLWLGECNAHRTPVPAVDFLGALHALTGGMPAVCAVELRSHTRRQRDDVSTWECVNHFVQVFGVLADGTPWLLVMPEMYDGVAKLARWLQNDRPLTAAEKRTQRW